MRIRVVDNLQEFNAVFGFNVDGILLDPTIDEIETPCDLNGRKRRDAEVLATIAANNSGDCLEIGTSFGHGTHKIATNIHGAGTVYTVNVLPEQIGSDEKLVTHLLKREDIGSYFRGRRIDNIRQIYANTMDWRIPSEVDHLVMGFIDGNHDTEAVHSDTLLIYDRIKDGGFIVWHDFSPLYRPQFEWIDCVMKGVERSLEELGIDAEIVNLKHSWMGVLKKSSLPGRLLNCRKTAAVQVIDEVPVRPSAGLTVGWSLKFLLAYPGYSQSRIDEEENYASRIRALGYDVTGFAVPCAGGWWQYPRLDSEYRNPSSPIHEAYRRLEEALQDRDVLISAGGSMLHPAFVEKQKVFSVFTCADDPESSDVLSRPVAPSFDYAFTYNLACVDMYRSWGCRDVSWLFHPINSDLIDPSISHEGILGEDRDIDAVMFCERISGLSDRAARIERLVREFPSAMVRGKGWKGGYLRLDELTRAYRNARIGWNLHNSTGPTNTRTTMLPSYGILQICDNPSHLGKLFKLDEEVVGFETVEECIDKTRYFLSHEVERRRIAANGWRRATSDYTEKRHWELILRRIMPGLSLKRGEPKIR